MIHAAHRSASHTLYCRARQHDRDLQRCTMQSCPAAEYPYDALSMQRGPQAYSAMKPNMLGTRCFGIKKPARRTRSTTVNSSSFYDLYRLVCACFVFFASSGLSESTLMAALHLRKFASGSAEMTPSLSHQALCRHLNNDLMTQLSIYKSRTNNKDLFRLL